MNQLVLYEVTFWADYFGRKNFWKNHKFRWKILEFSKKGWVRTWVGDGWRWRLGSLDREFFSLQEKSYDDPSEPFALYKKSKIKDFIENFQLFFRLFLFFLELEWYLYIETILIRKTIVYSKILCRPIRCLRSVLKF